MAQDNAIWIDVLPNMSKFGPAVTAGTAGPAGAAGLATGKAFGLAMIAGVAVVAGAAVIAGKALYDLGKTFDDMTDGIRVGTGATGDALDGLVDSAKNISQKVPASFEDIGTAVADVNTRMGLTGDTLESVAAQVLEAGRLTGEAIDVNKITAAFSVFKVEGEDATGAMDTLFRVSQDTGIGMNELAGIVQKAGPAIQELGFDFDQTAALVGGLDKAGLDASKMTAGLSRSLVELAKDGEEPAEAFQRVTGEMKGLIDAGDTAGATDIAAKLFGTKNAPQFLQAVKDGKLSMDDLTAAAVGSGDTIMQASEDTASFGEKWQVFKNIIAVQVEPIATKLFDTISAGMGWIADNAVPFINRMNDAWQQGEGPLGRVREAFGTVADVIRDHVVPFVMQIAGIISDTLGPILKDMARIFSETILPVLSDFWAFLQANVIPVVLRFGNNVVLPIMRLVGGALQLMWAIVSPILEAFWWVIKNVLGPVLSFLWTNVVAPVMDNIGAKVGDKIGLVLEWFGKIKGFIDDTLVPAFKRFADKVAEVFNGLKSAIAIPVNFIITKIWNDGLRKALNLIPGVDLKEASTIAVGGSGGAKTGGGGKKIAYARQRGGFIDLPWDSKHRDPYMGQTRNGGFFAFEGEEFIVNRQQTRKHLDLLERINAGQFDDTTDMPRYARGGRVHPIRSGLGTSYRGHTGRDFGRAFGGGFGATVKAAGAGVITRTAKLAKSYGWHIRQRLDEGLNAVYAHLSHIGVRPGQRVAMGEPIGRTGNTGHSFGAHLHFGINESDPATVAFLQGAAVSKGSFGGGGAPAPGMTESGVNLFTEIPRIFKEVTGSIKSGLTGPWASQVLVPAVQHALGKARDWVYEKIPGLSEAVEFGKSIWGFITGRGKDTGGKEGTAQSFLNGGVARFGPATLSEDGRPELVVGPQYRHMLGGERIYNAGDTSRLLSGGSGQSRIVAGELRIDEDGRAFFRGIAEDVVADNADSERRWDRMGSR